MAPPAGVATSTAPVISTSDEQTLKTYYKTKIEEAQVSTKFDNTLVSLLAKSLGKRSKRSSSSSSEK